MARPPFVPFDEQRAVHVYQRNLPHWRQDGVTYFVTFRLADSIPAAIHSRWEAEKAAWLEQRGIAFTAGWQQRFARLSATEQFRFQQLFNRQVQSCLDRGLGDCWLRRVDCLQIVGERMLALDLSLCHVGDFIIMPNHVHALLTPVAGQKLEMILKRIKGASALACNRLLGRAGSFWQADSYDHIVRSLEQLEQYGEYIRENPAKAGIHVPDSAHYVAEWMNDWLRME